VLPQKHACFPFCFRVKQRDFNEYISMVVFTKDWSNFSIKVDFCLMQFSWEPGCVLMSGKLTKLGTEN
jgi:hypothetical protein